MEGYRKWFGEKERDRTTMLLKEGEAAILTPASTHQVWTRTPVFAVGVELLINSLNGYFREETTAENEMKNIVITPIRAECIASLEEPMAWTGPGDDFQKTRTFLAAHRLAKNLQEEDSKKSIYGGDVGVSGKRTQPDRVAKDEAANTRVIKKFLEEDEKNLMMQMKMMKLSQLSQCLNLFRRK